MWHRRHGAAALVITALAGWAFDPARADEYTGFRIPEHSLVFATGSFDAAGVRNAASDPGASSRDANHTGTVAGLYERLFAADAHAWSTSLTAQAAGRRSSATSGPAGFFNDRTQARTVNAQERFRLGAGYTRFIGSRDLRVSLDGSVGGSYVQRWEAGWREQQPDSVLTRQEYDVEAWDYLPSHRITLGTGIGRVRDVTGIAQMLLLERRLRAAGILTRDLSATARQRLAEIVHLRGRTGSVRERPARGSWLEIERILRDDGAMAGEFVPAEAALQAIEPVLGATSGISRDALASDLFRERGTALIVSLGALESQAIHRSELHGITRVSQPGLPDVVSESRQSQQLRSIVDRYPLDIRLLHARPVGLHRVWSGTLGFTRELRRKVQASDASARLSTTWILVDRWTADAAAQWNRSWSGDLDYADGWNVALGASLRYHIEDRVTLSATLQHGQTRSGDFYRRGESYSAGLTYRFAGRLIAPAFPGLAHTGAGYAVQ